MAMLSRYPEVSVKIGKFLSRWYSYRVLVEVQKKRGEKNTQVFIHHLCLISCDGVLGSIMVNTPPPMSCVLA